jgi:glycosyltransferase involved in cell wall biosynthesis
MNSYLRSNVLSGFDSVPIIETIPCCIDLESFRYNGAKNELLKEKFRLRDKFVFVYAGSLGTYNLLDEMLDFFKISLAHMPHAHFLILTHTPGPIRQALSRHGIESKFLTVAFASRDELPHFLCLGKAGIIFRRPTLPARASSPTKFAEYLACGLPVVSGPGIGDLDRIIASYDIGVVLNTYNRQEYERAIEKLNDLFLDAERIRKRCRQVAQDLFSLERGYKSYLDVYNNLISGVR